MHINEIQKEVHATALEHGWWDGAKEDGFSLPEKIALMHSELSEALEEFRNHKPSIYFEGDKPEGIMIELADCIIRILDLAGYMGWDMEQALNVKMTYNETRPYRHGGKKI